MAQHYTLGVEEEYQIVDPSSGDLVSHVTQLLGSEANPAESDLSYRERLRALYRKHSPRSGS